MRLKISTFSNILYVELFEDAGNPFKLKKKNVPVNADAVATPGLTSAGVSEPCCSGGSGLAIAFSARSMSLLLSGKKASVIVESTPSRLPFHLHRSLLHGDGSQRWF